MSSEIDCIKVQKKLIPLLKETIDFLDKHEFRWWMAYGSAIGTARHHGFIPWDDDLDIFMPYEDYIRLLEMRDEFKGTNLALDIPFSDNNCCAYAKIYDKNSTVWQEEEYESIIGLWIDVFPLFQSDMTEMDYWNNVRKFDKLNKDYRGGVRKFKFGIFLFYLKEFQLSAIKRLIYDMIVRKWMLKKTIKDFSTFLHSLNNPFGHYYVFPFTYSKALNRFPIEWFKESVDMQFEGLTVKMISCYDEMLTQLYGDYMTPPSRDKQMSTHVFYYLDLNHHYTKGEILHQLVKK